MMFHKRWAGLTAIMAGTAIVFLDQTVLPVALPTIQAKLGGSNVNIQWTVNIYFLVISALVLAAGKLSDRIGHRKIFSWGMWIFGISSALCALSSNIGALIVSRGLQGIGASFLFAAGAPLVMTLFGENERGKARGVQAGVSSIFLILGPFIGGYLTEFHSWRWIFWINLPITFLGVILTQLFVPLSPKYKNPIDKWGFIFFLISCSSVVTLLMYVNEWGFNSAPIISLLAVFVIATIFLLLREKKAEYPFLDLSLLKHPIFRGANISTCTIQFVMMIAIFRSIFFQDVLEWSPIKTGLITVVTTLPALVVSPLAGILADRYGAKIPLVLGFLIMIYSFIWTPLIIQSSLVLILIGLFAYGIGIPLTLTPSYSSAMNAIPMTKAGSAFGIVTTLRNLSATLGVAVIGTILDTVHLLSFQRLVKKNELTRNLDPQLIEGLVYSTDASREQLQALSPTKSQLLTQFLHKAEIEGFFYSHIIMAVFLITALGLIFILYNRESKSTNL